MIGTNLKNLRKRKKITQERLAEMLGVTRQAISMWEANKREPDLAIIYKISSLFRIKIDDMVKPEKGLIFKGGYIGGGAGEGIKMVKEREVMNMKNLISKAINRKEIEMATKSRTVTVDFELLAPEANRVSVTGDFNSWDIDGILMRRSKNGLWNKEVSLKPGKYEYKYIVDGQWCTDPLNTNTAMNPFGSLNSVREVR